MNKTISIILLLISIFSISSCERADIFKLSRETIIGEIPVAPASLAAIAVSSNEVRLSWIDNSNNETGFILERSMDGNTFSEIISTGVDSTSYRDSGLSASATYYYRIKATNAAGDSPYSNNTSALTFCELLAHWKLDGSFLDETGNNNATITGSFSYTTGRDGDCPTFDWSNAGVVSAPAGMDKDIYTVTAWVKRYSHNTAPYIRLSGIAHLITDASTGLWQLIGEGEIANINFGYSLPLFEWHHFTVVLDRVNNKVSYYLDGVNAGSQSITPWTVDPTEIRIGEHSGSFKWNGCIDDVRIYGGRLSDSQIQDLYNSYPAGVSEPAPADPSGLNVNPVSYSSIQLTWSDNANNEYGYRVEQSSDAGTSYSIIGTTVPNASSYTVTGLTASTTYFYRVVAFNASDSAYTPAKSATTESPGVLPELIAHWKMENNLNDETGNNHATETNTFSYMTGRDGQCAVFDTTNYGGVSSPYGLDRDIYTVMAWVSRTNHNTAPYIRLTGIAHLITYSTGQWRFVGENGATTNLSSAYVLPLNEWHHFTTVINRSQGTVKFYLDGILNDTFSTTPWMSSGTSILLGRFDNAFMWDGEIDDTRIYGGELTDSEITTIVNSY